MQKTRYTSDLSNFVSKVRHLLGGRSRRQPDSRRRRKLFLEPLEGRQLLAITNLAAIGGVVYDDFNGNGPDPAELIAGATVNLFADDGDGLFQPGGLDGNSISTATTDTAGRYQFNNLTAGGYFVQQPAQTVAGRTLLVDQSNLITLTPTNAMGATVLAIDSFNVTTQSVTDSTSDATPVTSAVAATEATGNERDLFVNLTSAGGSISLRANDLGQPRLAFDSASGGDGQRLVTWDGPDGNASVVDDTGLATIDLTANSAVGLRVDMGADLAGASAVVRVFSNDGVGGTQTRFSELTTSIAVTGGVTTEESLLLFGSFLTGGTTAADFAAVTAVQLEITGASNVDGVFELVGTVGPSVTAQDFANFEQADLTVTKVVDLPSPNVGQNVNFTVTVSNAGPDGATNVTVGDILPAGLTFVSSTPSQGAYDNNTGVWTVGSMASGANQSLAIVATVDNPGTKTNTAQVSASDQFDPDSTPNNSVPAEDDQDNAAVTPQVADLSITKTVDNAAPNVGQTVTFTVTLTNAGPNTASNVTVGDNLPAGVTFVSATPSVGAYSNATGVWTVGNVANGASATLQLVATVDSTGTKTNTAQVTVADQADIDSTPNNNIATEDDQDDAAVTPPIVDLSVSKAVDNASPGLGQNVTFTVAVANAGPDTATSVTVGDTLSVGTTFVSATPSQGAYDNNTGVWTVGTLANGANASLQILATVTTLGTKTNTAQVTAVDQTDSDSTPNNGLGAEDDQDDAVITPQAVDLSLIKTVDNATPNLGQNVSFSVTLSNAGPNTATNVSIGDAVPAGMTFVSSTPSQGTYDSNAGVWTVGTLSSGANATLLIVASVDTAGTKTNTAQVTAVDQTDIDSTPNNNLLAEDDQDDAAVTPQFVDLSVAKSVDNATPDVGQNVTFSVTVSNGGPNTATNVVLGDALPAGMTFVSGTPSQGTYDNAAGVWTVGSLVNGANADLQIIATVATAGTKTNTAQVTSVDQADVDSTPNNNISAEDDQDDAAITPRTADLSVTKTVSNATPDINDNINFTVTVSNAGPVNATNVAVSDPLPTGLGFVSSVPSQGSYNNGTGVWTVGTVANGANATLQITASVTSFGIITNTAQVSAADQFDPDSTPSNNAVAEDDQANVAVQPILSFSKRLFLAR
jgi:uncharacterized repeat protein (TIGR01451 family)